MTLNRLAAAAIALWLPCLPRVLADELRYYERNGITYCEVRRTAPPGYAQAAASPSRRTVVGEQITTGTRQAIRTSWTPVTEYQWESHWVNRWNPFAEPRLEFRCVPRTRWEQRSEVVCVPVACRRLVPATGTAPVMARRNASLETVARIPVSELSTKAPSGSASAARVAQLIPYGGVSRLDNQPPRSPSGSGSGTDGRAWTQTTPW